LFTDNFFIQANTLYFVFLLDFLTFFDTKRQIKHSVRWKRFVQNEQTLRNALVKAIGFAGAFRFFRSMQKAVGMTA